MFVHLHRRQLLGLLTLGPLFACVSGSAPAPAPAPAPDPAPEPTPDRAPDLELVETIPIETTLGRRREPAAATAATAATWRAMIDRARTTLDLGEFYLADAPGSRLGPIVAAIKSAAGRRVRVRLLLDARFAANDAELTADLAAIQGVEVRRLDLAELGGVMHAKYFVVDGREAYLGSANFDWRALEHIHELGVRLREPALVRGIAAIFAMDWAAAGGETSLATAGDRSPAPRATLDFAGEPHRVTLVASPEGRLPDLSWWDLPRLLALLGGARERIQLQLLSYAIIGYSGESFVAIDRALRAAASRGVDVDLMVADWSLRSPALDALQALARVPGIDIRVVTIPAARAGFIPFARVIHSKAMTVDGRAAWIGTSNFSGDYFYASRNLGLIVEGEAFAAAIAAIFGELWSAAYARDLDPEARYDPPAIAAPAPAAAAP